MVRAQSKVAEGWWDYTPLDKTILDDAAGLSAEAIPHLGREGFAIRMYDTLEDFYTAEALEYIRSWKNSSADSPTGICGPIGPTEQLPLVARIINDLDVDVREGHFWGMDEWYKDGADVPITHPLSFAGADMELCFNRIRPELRMPNENLHFPSAAGIEEYSQSFDQAECLVMQGGQGDVKHWAFNDPVRREGQWSDAPPPPETYQKLGARIVELHPITVMQNARTSGGGVLQNVPAHALTVGPRETWKSRRVSIWHAGLHDNAFGMRLTTLMISKRIADSAVPMSLLADHPDVVFNFYRPGLGNCDIEMH
ncbi:MAG: glucosamine-6-phosphate isomerase [Spirochaetales bacterium]|nr:glucosamine-6-phosphate isomerase [Spirochaetales bacterium]